MAHSNSSKQQTTENDFMTAFDALTALIAVMIGGTARRSRIGKFGLPPEVEVYKTEAFAHFVGGHFYQAVGNVNEAVKCLLAMERAYARNSVQKFFIPLMGRVGKLDGDLNDAIGKKFTDYVEQVRLMNSSSNYDMDQVSRSYWALLERIESAPKEQAARLANREKKQKKAEQKLSAEVLAERKKEQERRDEEARAAQAEADTRRRKEREARVRELQAAFNSVAV